MAKKIIYSGVKPTVHSLTLGNYIGAVKNWLELQENEDYSCIYAIADLHALTVREVPAELRARSISLFAQYLALGLDPEKNIMYMQSHVHEHAELSWILSCYTYVGEAGRMTQFKDKSAKHADNVNMGLMSYPILMAADILLFNTDLVPIGIDQNQHLELARDIANRFNNAYSPTFTVPEGALGRVGAKIMSLQDPTSKMSKTDKNDNATIYMLDDKDAIMRKIKRAVTDSIGEVRLSDDQPGVKNLLSIYAACNNISLEEAYNSCKSLNYAELKECVGESIVVLTEPFRAKYNEIIANKAELNDILANGAERASAIARKTLRKVYKKVGLYQL